MWNRISSQRYFVVLMNCLFPGFYSKCNSLLCIFKQSLWVENANSNMPFQLAACNNVCSTFMIGWRCIMALLLCWMWSDWLYWLVYIVQGDIINVSCIILCTNPMQDDWDPMQPKQLWEMCFSYSPLCSHLAHILLFIVWTKDIKALFTNFHHVTLTDPWYDVCHHFTV